MAEEIKPSGIQVKGVPDEIIERFRAKVPKLEKIETPFGPFWVRRPNGEDQWQLLQFQNDLEKKGHKSMPPALIVAACLRTEDGELVWKETQDGYLFLNTVDADALNEAFKEVLRVTGIGKRALELAEKKSSSSQSSDSGTSSSPQ